jgi:glycosyltransferase involved in cell wall biosynthesis
VVTVHDLTFVEHPEWHERSKVMVFSRALRQSAERADVVICVSQHTADRYLERFRPRGEVRVVMHGVDHTRFHPGPDDGTDEAVLGALGIHTPYLVHVGTIEPRKNIPNLIRAFDVVGACNPDLRLVLAGQLAWGEQELGYAIAASSLSDRIVQLGYVADDCVAPLLRGAAAVAYPSIEEGFGLPALEALACGAPLLTSSNSVMSEFAGDAALCVDAHDVDELASALAELLESGSRQVERREKGLVRAREFTWDRSAAGHVDSYRLALRS